MKLAQGIKSWTSQPNAARFLLMSPLPPRGRGIPAARDRLTEGGGKFSPSVVGQEQVLEHIILACWHDH